MFAAEAGYDSGMTTSQPAGLGISRSLRGGAVIAAALALVSLVLLGSPSAVGASPTRTAPLTSTTKQAAHRMTRLVVRVPQCGNSDGCFVTIFHDYRPPHAAEVKDEWKSHVRGVLNHRAVFHVARYRTTGLSMSFTSAKTAFDTDAVVRWYGARPGHKQTYRPSNPAAGLCWNGPKVARVSVTLHIQYFIYPDPVSPERVARVWFARAGRSGRIPPSNKLPHGVMFDNGNAGFLCNQ
jgi:hypothetical protein